jgi:predicted phosphate transport protein (TIGR00153 family)
MSLIADLFGRSPIRPMQRHIHVSVACAREVLPLFEDMAAGRVDKLPERRAEIDRLEHEADSIKHEIRSHMPNRMFMAVERRAMLEILDFQDSIADVAQDVAELVDQRSMTIPEPLAEPLLALVRRVVAACDQAVRIVDELDELLETGFGKRETARVQEMVGALEKIESETDELADRVHRQLFAMEDELGVGTIFWDRVVRWVGDMADYAERVGGRIRLLIAS